MKILPAGKFKVTVSALLLSLLCATTLIAPNAASAENAVQGFDVWKQSRIDEARGLLDKNQQDEFKPAVETIHGIAHGIEAKAPRTAVVVSPKLRQLKVNFDIANELTINDYVVLYLRQFKNNRTAFLEAAKSLTPEQTADLLMSYERHLSGAADFDEPQMPAATTASVGALPAKSVSGANRSFDTAVAPRVR